MNLQRPTTCCRALTCPFQDQRTRICAANASYVWRDWSNLPSYPPTLAPTVGATTACAIRSPTLRGWQRDVASYFRFFQKFGPFVIDATRLPARDQLPPASPWGLSESQRSTWHGDSDMCGQIFRLLRSPAVLSMCDT